MIYIQPRNVPALPETGDNLGQTQSELKSGEIIVEVVCAAPKNYASKTYYSVTGESKTVCKVTGITLNYSASQLVNFAKTKDMILKDDAETVIVHTKNKIKQKE